MLVYEEYRDVLAIMSKPIECLFDSRIFGFGIDHKEVLLRIRWMCDVLSVHI